ncbi:hypothetical protein A2U01_0110505, partial [Trifolium medium]|nr:hypothetical protein [Trifolium medium]
MKQVRENRGLSDDEYDTDELVSDDEGDEEGEGEELSKTKFATFVMPKKMFDYKWE